MLVVWNVKWKWKAHTCQSTCLSCKMSNWHENVDNPFACLTSLNYVWSEGINTWQFNMILACALEWRQGDSLGGHKPHWCSSAPWHVLFNLVESPCRLAYPNHIYINRPIYGTYIRHLALSVFIPDPAIRNTVESEVHRDSSNLWYIGSRLWLAGWKWNLYGKELYFTSGESNSSWIAVLAWGPSLETSL